MSGLFSGTSLERPVTCEVCNRPFAGPPQAVCACPRGRDGRVLRPKDQPIRIRREKRGGKLVCVVAGFAPRSDRSHDLPDLLAVLKKRLGAGGSLEDTPQGPTIVLQGDHRDKLVEHFRTLGYPAKPAGG